MEVALFTKRKLDSGSNRETEGGKVKEKERKESSQDLFPSLSLFLSPCSSTFFQKTNVLTNMRKE